MIISVSFLNCIAYDNIAVFFPRTSVSDLLDYITPDAEMKARDAQKKQARAKVENI